MKMTLVEMIFWAAKLHFEWIFQFAMLDNQMGITNWTIHILCVQVGALFNTFWTHKVAGSSRDM